MTCAAVITTMAMGALWVVAPAELREGPAIAAQLLVAAGMCVLLTDAFL